MLFKGFPIPENFLINLRYTFAAPKKDRICVTLRGKVQFHERFRVVKGYRKLTTRYHVTQVVNTWFEELTFPEFECNFILPKKGKDFVHVTQVKRDVLGEYYHVIQVDQACLSAHARQYYIQCALKRGWRVPQPEWHPEVPEGSKVCREGILVPMFRCNGHSPIARIAVKVRKYCRVTKGTKKVIHAW